jgi:hypothetical protein
VSTFRVSLSFWKEAMSTFLSLFFSIVSILVGARGSAQVVGVLDGRTRQRSPAAAALGHHPGGRRPGLGGSAKEDRGTRLSPRLLKLQRGYRDPVEPERLCSISSYPPRY